MAHMSMVVVLWVEVADGTGTRVKPGALPLLQKQQQGFLLSPTGRWAPCLPPIPGHISMASGKRELRSVGLGTL